ncbi:UNVERIFIED_CONTAM: hypothetical protein FKN15_020312 [Acipenser sinensis]
MGSAYQFHSWRVFVLVCAFPSVFAIAALTPMPESPRFFLENGKHDEAWMILKQVHDTNMRAKGHPERVFSVTTIKTVKQLDELVEMDADTGTWHRRWRMRLSCLFHQVTTIKTVKQLDELVEMDADTGTWHRRWRMRLSCLFHQVQCDTVLLNPAP